MEPLAKPADIVARLGRPLAANEATRVDALLLDASASVRNYTRQQISESESTERLTVRNGKVLLPQRPATAVSAVLSPAGGDMAFAWQGADVLLVAGSLTDSWSWQFEPFANGFDRATADVTYTHGYPDGSVPDDIVGVVCSIVMRAVGREPLDAGVTSESIQGYSYALGVVGAAGAFGLLNAERDILDAYRRTAGRVDTSR